MLDLNTIRADFAAFLAAHAATKHSLDAALMRVVEHAYQQGLTDGVEMALGDMELRIQALQETPTRKDAP